jgi:signal transduction histidine kinase
VLRGAIGLRLRLTLTYALVGTAILASLGIIFRQTLASTLHQNAAAILEEEWGAVKGYLRIERGRPVWFYDRDDNEEAAMVLKFRQGLLLIADSSGQVLEASDYYTYLGVESANEIRTLAATKGGIRQRTDSDGYSHLIRFGIQTDDEKRSYFVAIGRTLDAEEAVLTTFTQRYISLVPLLIFASSVASWWAAGRALEPLKSVASAARSITGENLRTRIERRGANDELDHLIDAFNNMVDRLESTFNQIRQFSMDVSHEMRTPLTAIRGQLEVALMTSDSKEQFKDAMVSAMDDVDRLAKVVRALLQLSQAESGQVRLAFEPIDLAREARDAAEQFEVVVEAEGLALETHLEPRSTVLGDKIQLGRLISNLLSNSIKYTGAGGTISLSVLQRGAEVELAVLSGS